MLKSFAIAFLGTLAVLASPARAGELWVADFDKAAEQARKEGKDLFVDFTGSDWCSWCIKLHKEVFSFEEFTAAATKDFVLVSLDFPRSDAAKALVPNPQRNEELSRKYEIRGFPTVLLMTPDGEVYGQTGYREGGPSAYVAHLGEIRESGRKALVDSKRLASEFQAAQGDERFAVAQKALEAFDALDELSPFRDVLREPLEWLLESDANNARGLQERAFRSLVGAGQLGPKVKAAAHGLDPKNERGLVEQYVRATFERVQDDEAAKEALKALDELLPMGIREKETSFELQSLAALWCAGPLMDTDRAKVYAAAAKAIGSSDKRRLEMLEQILAG